MEYLVKLTDWLGNEYGAGDLVIYGASGGRSITMIQGKILDIWQVYRSKDFKWVRLPEGEDPPDYVKPGDYDHGLELRVRVQPLNSSRWEHNRPRRYYIDNRNGKHIEPWMSDKHIKSPAYYTDIRTGMRCDDRRHMSYEERNKFLKYVDVVFQDYVEEVIEDAPRPVTLSVTENIVRWTQL
jgi:hypothetical protein